MDTSKRQLSLRANCQSTNRAFLPFKSASTFFTVTVPEVGRVKLSSVLMSEGITMLYEAQPPRGYKSSWFPVFSLISINQYFHSQNSIPFNHNIDLLAHYHNEFAAARLPSILWVNRRIHSWNLLRTTPDTTPGSASTGNKILLLRLPKWTHVYQTPPCLCLLRPSTMRLLQIYTVRCGGNSSGHPRYILIIIKLLVTLLTLKLAYDTGSETTFDQPEAGHRCYRITRVEDLVLDLFLRRRFALRGFP